MVERNASSWARVFSCVVVLWIFILLVDDKREMMRRVIHVFKHICKYMCIHDCKYNRDLISTIIVYISVFFLSGMRLLNISVPLPILIFICILLSLPLVAFKGLTLFLFLYLYISRSLALWFLLTCDQGIMLAPSQKLQSPRKPNKLDTLYICTY